MESVGDNNKNAVRGKKVLAVNEGAPVCFLCEKSYVSMKHLYDHIRCDHSDSDWKSFLALHNTTAIDIVSHRHLEATAIECLFKCKVAGKRGCTGLKLANDCEEIDEESRQMAEAVMLLARDHMPPSKAAEPTVEKKLIQDDEFKGGYKAVHDFDLNSDPPLTAMEDED